MRRLLFATTDRKQESKPKEAERLPKQAADPEEADRPLKDAAVDAGTEGADRPPKETAGEAGFKEADRPPNEAAGSKEAADSKEADRPPKESPQMSSQGSHNSSHFSSSWRECRRFKRSWSGMEVMKVPWNLRWCDIQLIFHAWLIGLLTRRLY